MQGIRGQYNPQMNKMAHHDGVNANSPSVGFGCKSLSGSASTLVLNSEHLANRLHSMAPGAIQPVPLSTTSSLANAENELIESLVQELCDENNMQFEQSSTRVIAEKPPKAIWTDEDIARFINSKKKPPEKTLSNASSDLSAVSSAVDLSRYASSSLSGALAQSGSFATLHPEAQVLGAPNARQ